MRLKNCLIVVAIAFFVIYLGSVVTMSIGEVYGSNISITTFSEYEHRIVNKFLGANLSDEPNIILLTPQDLKDYPIITDLIALTEKREPPKNTTGYIYLTFDELKSIIEPLAEKLALQKGGQSSDYIRINDDEGDGIFYYEFATEFFYIDEQLYNIQDLYAIEDFDKIKFEIRKSEENYWIKDFIKVHLTSEDVKSMPNLQKALEEIGKYYEDIQESKGVVESEYFKYYDWAVSMKIIDPNDYEYTQNTYIQYNDKLYLLSFHGN